VHQAHVCRHLHGRKYKLQSFVKICHEDGDAACCIGALLLDRFVWVAASRLIGRKEGFSCEEGKWRFLLSCMFWPSNCCGYAERPFWQCGSIGQDLLLQPPYPEQEQGKH
jgi:hypothetical protein